jgi:hypothetical protein
MDKIKNINKKIILGVIGVSVAIVSGYMLFSDKGKQEVQTTVEENQENMNEFGEMTKFFRENLSEEEKMELKKEISKFRGSVYEAENILKMAFDSKKSEMGIAFKKSNDLMNIVKVKLLRFVDKSKVEGFNKM